MICPRCGYKKINIFFRNSKYPEDFVCKQCHAVLHTKGFWKISSTGFLPLLITVMFTMAMIKNPNIISISIVTFIGLALFFMNKYTPLYDTGNTIKIKKRGEPDIEFGKSSKIIITVLVGILFGILAFYYFFESYGFILFLIGVVDIILLSMITLPSQIRQFAAYACTSKLVKIKTQNNFTDIEINQKTKKIFSKASQFGFKFEGYLVFMHSNQRGRFYYLSHPEKRLYLLIKEGGYKIKRKKYQIKIISLFQENWKLETSNSIFEHLFERFIFSNEKSLWEAHGRRKFTYLFEQHCKLKEEVKRLTGKDEMPLMDIEQYAQREREQRITRVE